MPYFIILNNGYVPHYLNQNLHILTAIKPVVIQTDASEYDLDAALLQDARAIAFATKNLTDVKT